MNSADHRWSLVLAAGAGTRLNSLTTVRDSVAVPKQFWSLAGGASLLEETLERASAVTGADRVVVVVAAEHRAYWQGVLRGLPTENVIVQPRNCGTAIGILLGMTAILARDVHARVVMLPSDHFVEQESALRRSILRVLASPPRGREITFLGIRPDDVDPELGYIVRGAPDAGGGFRIARFIEKPDRETAQDLIARSALWNSFILIATARAFVDLIGQRHAALAEAFRCAFGTAVDSPEASAVLERLYAGLPSLDFSRDVVEGADAPLRVVAVPACGWSDLGTPRRVAACLDRIGARRYAVDAAQLSLAAAQSRLTQFGAAALAG
ncbi:MAG TPA: sugar phosphate nucleotidyltransferase [Gammaproteobacteria bacterium]|nr:sugar phosphate nucleotidyltransferase [Gammaproteobacteria bacterium]